MIESLPELAVPTKELVLIEGQQLQEPSVIRVAPLPTTVVSSPLGAVIEGVIDGQEAEVRLAATRALTTECNEEFAFGALKCLRSSDPDRGGITPVILTAPMGDAAHLTETLGTPVRSAICVCGITMELFWRQRSSAFTARLHGRSIPCSNGGFCAQFAADPTNPKNAPKEDAA